MTKLKMDFDARVLPRDLETRLTFAVRLHRLRVLWRSYRRTVHGWHVVVAVSGRVALWRVVLIQAACGSDWRRELFNGSRIMVARRVPPLWRDRINVLYVAHHRGVKLSPSPRDYAIPRDQHP